MSKLAADDKTVALRRPETVMRLARLGSMHQTRLSFMRQLTRRLKRENWTFSRPEFAINQQGVGYALYCAHGPNHTYTLVAFAHDLPPEQRSDRVIAEAWDTTFTLFDGVPSHADIERLARNVPLQEAGRISEKELSLSRANRSARLWQHVVSRLAAGQQPDQAQIDAVGYLMRTTAVYGSGKFGAADREMILDRPECAAPFQIEMLSVYLIRTFVRDLVQHMAQMQGGDNAVTLDPDIARSLGIGNSTGLGMAPFIINHPLLFNNWINAREQALAKVRSITTASDQAISCFRDMLARMNVLVARWHSQHPIQIEKLAQLRTDLAALSDHISSAELSQNQPWNRLYQWAENSLSLEGQECVASLLLEPYADLVDPLADSMASSARHPQRINGAMTLAQLKQLLTDHYSWAIDIDWSNSEQCARAWYISEEKLEPRLGERFAEPIEAYEQPLAPGRDIAQLYQAIQDWPDESLVAEFLLHNAEHRHSVRRAQMTQHAPYAEIYDNTISAELRPIDMLRCKLSFFGATHFDPRSDRWVRICMYPDAPYPEELVHGDADFWPYPTLERS